MDLSLNELLNDIKELNKYIQINLDKEFTTYKSGLSFFIKNNSTNQYITNQNEKYSWYSCYRDYIYICHRQLGRFQPRILRTMISTI